MKLATLSSEETEKLGYDLLNKFPNLELILIDGEIGSGKTTLIKGIASYLHSFDLPVTSPSFNFKVSYQHFIHYDLYFLKSENKKEIYESLLEDISNNLVIVEWSKKIRKLKHIKNSLHILIKKRKNGTRLIIIKKN